MLWRSQQSESPVWIEIDHMHTNYCGEAPSFKTCKNQYKTKLWHSLHLNSQLVKSTFLLLTPTHCPASIRACMTFEKINNFVCFVLFQHKQWGGPAVTVKNVSVYLKLPSKSSENNEHFMRLKRDEEQNRRDFPDHLMIILKKVQKINRNLHILAIESVQIWHLRIVNNTLLDLRLFFIYII